MCVCVGALLIQAMFLTPSTFWAFTLMFDFSHLFSFFSTFFFLSVTWANAVPVRDQPVLFDRQGDVEVVVVRGGGRVGAIPAVNERFCRSAGTLIDWTGGGSQGCPSDQGREGRRERDKVAPSQKSYSLCLTSLQKRPSVPGSDTSSTLHTLGFAFILNSVI